MRSIEIVRTGTNFQALDESLRTAFGGVYIGLSARPGGVLEIHFSEDATAAQLDQGQQMVVAHDPGLLSATQQAESERKSALAQSRASHPAELDLADFLGESPLDKLAARVLWLERELRDLRDL